MGADSFRDVIRAKSRAKRGVPFTLASLVGAVALIAAITAATKPLAAAQFAMNGHWVYNSILQNVFHIDGATAGIDAQAAVNAEAGSQVVQGDTSGYVVGPTTITEFSLSSLSILRTIKAPADELPVSVEVVGGPYLVYRNAGKVARLGDPTAVISVGGAVGDPVVTSDGTMWLHSKQLGALCTLRKGAERVEGCSVGVPRDHPGALTVIDDRPLFVDLFTSTLHQVEGDKLGAGVPIGVPVSPNSRPAPTDLAGRVAILDPERHSILLADNKNPPQKPVTVGLPGGDYDGPVSTGSVVVLVDRQSGNVLTFGADGRPRDTKAIEHKNGKPKLSQGEDDRVYVEDANGTQVLVVGKDGSVRDVSVTGKPAAPTQTPERSPDGNAGGPPVQQQQPTGPRQPTGPPSTSRTTPPPPAPLPATVPGAPTAVAAVAGSGSATVTWGPAPDNRAQVTSYQLSWQGGSMTVSGGARKATVNGLTNGVRYTITVSATNRVGTGPGASANPITPNSPASPASAPTNLQKIYDVDDRPTRDVRLTWGQPALNGGTLQHYEITATGQGTKTSTTTSYTFPQLRADTTYTMTVRAITRSPDGQTLTGQAASTTVQDSPAPTPKIQIAKGRKTTSSNCHAPSCAFVNATLTGFEPRKTYRLQLSSRANSDVVHENATTDANGNVNYNQLNYDVPGETVFVFAIGPNGRVESNRITWS